MRSQEIKERKIVQHLTLQDVVTACRKALEDGTLGALRHHSCQYDYGDGYHCAVGVALTTDTLSIIRDKNLNLVSLESLLNLRILKIDREDFRDIERLQVRHDGWVDTLASNREEFEIELARCESKLSEQKERE